MCKYIIKEKKISKYIINDAENSDEEDSDEKDSDEQDSDEEDSSNKNKHYLTHKKQLLDFLKDPRVVS